MDLKENERIKERMDIIKAKLIKMGKANVDKIPPFRYGIAMNMYPDNEKAAQCLYDNKAV